VNVKERGVSEGRDGIVRNWRESARDGGWRGRMLRGILSGTLLLLLSLSLSLSSTAPSSVTPKKPSITPVLFSANHVSTFKSFSRSSKEEDGGAERGRGVCGDGGEGEGKGE